jgi:hypothetical protein
MEMVMDDIDRQLNLVANRALDQDAAFLADLMVQMTIAARASYAEATGSNTDVGYRALRAWNELFHQVTQRLSHVIGGGEDYPADVWCNILRDHARNGGVEADLAWAFGDALNRAAGGEGSDPSLRSG